MINQSDEVTREYKNELPDGTNDDQILSYYFIVDRNGIIDLSLSPSYVGSNYNATGEWSTSNVDIYNKYYNDSCKNELLKSIVFPEILKTIKEEIFIRRGDMYDGGN